MTAPDLSTRILFLLLAEPPHRWIALDVIARTVGCEEDRARHELRTLVRAGVVEGSGPAHDRRYQATPSARQTIRVAIREKGRGVEVFVS